MIEGKTLGEILTKGADRWNNVDLKKAQGRLEYVLEQNPHLDSDRLKVPSEFQDVLYYLNKYCYTETFKDAAKFLAGGLIGGALAYGCIEGAFALKEIDYAEYSPSVLALSGAFGSFGLIFSAIGTLFLVLGIKDYLNFRRDKWCQPLTPKERNLANYVLMDDSK
jgi:hypothetical protein